jgi:hypothetical protein
VNILGERSSHVSVGQHKPVEHGLRSQLRPGVWELRLANHPGE